MQRSQAMEFSFLSASITQEVVKLFTNVFSASEGEEEGQSIGTLVSNLMVRTDSQDLIGFVAKDSNRIVGCIFFSRLSVPDGQIAFILAPVAVATDVQGTGIGQQLIGYGLDHLRSESVDLVFTYGDPAFYSKTGFVQIGEDVVRAPYPLSQPIGWLAQSLDGNAIQAMHGTTRCVEALADPKYW